MDRNDFEEVSREAEDEYWASVKEVELLAEQGKITLEERDERIKQLDDDYGMEEGDQE